MTKIVVTHRLEEKVLTKYDEIIVLKNGEINESGTFNNLINEDSEFRSIYLIEQ